MNPSGNQMHEAFQVCAYDRTGRWAPALPGPGVPPADHDGWIAEVLVAILTALEAAQGGAARVVVRDRHDSTIVRIEHGAVAFPPELARLHRELGTNELVARLLVDIADLILAPAPAPASPQPRHVPPPLPIPSK